MTIVGIGGFQHDWSVTLAEDGELVFSGQLERFNRKKHSWFNTSEDLVEVMHELSQRFHKILNPTFVWIDSFLFHHSSKREDLRAFVETVWKEVVVLDHHMAHMASAYFSSPFSEATIVSLDGKWDDSSGKVWYGKGNRIDEVLSIPMEYSLGRLWNACNSVVWFPGFQYSGKTMALAGMWNPRYFQELFTFVSLLADGSYFFHLGDKLDSRRGREFFFQKKNIIELFCRIIGKQPRHPIEQLEDVHFDLAASLQLLTNVIAEHIAESAIKATGCGNLCIAWGVWLNGVMNSHLSRLGCVEWIFIQPASSDAWLSLGGIQYHLHRNLWLERKPNGTFNPYLGRDIESEDIVGVCQKNDWVNYHISSEIEKESAELLSDGKIIWWVQWREEIGPRALWNRSILASPIYPWMKDLINSKIKHRESFRPFAPAVLRERCEDFFTWNVDSPYMLLIDAAKDETKKMAPSIVHSDWTARLQTVTKEFNRRFHRLIREFEQISGVPILLNTSLNDNEEPIIGTAEQALGFFRRSQLDCLVIGNVMVTKRPQ